MIIGQNAIRLMNNLSDKYIALKRSKLSAKKDNIVLDLKSI